VGVTFGKLKKKIKKYWLWKRIFGANQQEHPEEKRLEMK
jgi:hypothetical protein